jgi:adenylylsulfate kinase
MTENVYWNELAVTKQHRQQLHGHKSLILWFTGLSGSGKSTIANIIEQKLYEQGVSTYLMDGDHLRHGLNADLNFSTEDRRENIRRVGEVAKLFVDSGMVVIATFVSPYRHDRQLIRSLVQPDEFIEIYIKCSLETCESRDPKGLYKRARRQEIKEFTGVSSPYEEPENPELIVESERLTPMECSEQIMTYLKTKSLLDLT